MLHCRYGQRSRLSSTSMASKAIRRRPCVADTDKGSEEKRMEAATVTDSVSVTEPLLGNSTQGNKSKGYEPRTRLDFWDEKTRKCLHWAHVVSNFISQSARNIVNAISEFGSWLARFFGCSSSAERSQNRHTVIVDLSPLQEERLHSVRQRLNVPFDCSVIKHQDALKELWRLAYPNRQLPPLKSELWKEMGWQNSDPASDFRAGGVMSLENLIYFARNYPGSFQRLLHKADGERAEWEYPFAVAGVNISYMLVQMLDLLSGNRMSKAGVCFVELLEDDEMAFDNLFCVAFQMLDAQWLARKASYMEFNEVLKSTLVQLERELTAGGVSSVHNLPSFRMLES
ncbi:ELMO domain-containing protein A isoform X2 [Brachypodium distachyon]|uniref:ELMO domain-containing protein A isoform X2 n=1 Tax=Brachypodium distachyon TaxID=15368 RepID=UPI000D0DD658|nr:ELMO domain-containing protein A isoform X2 [Brachypodium distachyon]|eukprot:XP_024310665.1 ELMO domain-containing protein A isoform X2 [Brachypodium distachyon]